MEIGELLVKYGVEIPTEQSEAFTKEFRGAFKSEQEFTKVVNQRDGYKADKESLSSQVATLNNNIVALETTKNDLTGQLTGYQRKEKIVNSNVDNKYVDYVGYEVAKLVTNEKDFDTALKEYVEENKHFLKGNVVNKNSGIDLNAKGGKPKTTSDIMNEAILKGAGKL